MLDHRCLPEGSIEFIGDVFSLDQLHLSQSAKYTSMGYAYIRGAKSSLLSNENNKLFDLSALHLKDSTDGKEEEDIWGAKQIGQ